MAKERLLSLDVFRGITMAAMIIVENPGNWSIYRPFSHASWGFPGENGIPVHQNITPTDLIFPFFVFIMGVAIPFALSRRREELSTHNKLIWRITKRSLGLFGIGLFFYAYPSLLSSILYGSEFGMRIPGVLQRLAIVYFAGSLLYLKFNKKTLIWISASVLVIYWGLITLVPVPGFGDPEFMRQWYEPENIPKNLPNWLDTVVFGYGDPEGILSSFPAIITGVLGVLSGMWLIEDRDKTTKTAWLFAIGTLIAVGGWVWGQFFPIIKDLWTSSYTLLAGGMAMMGLALCYWYVDVQKKTKWTMPFVAYGMNCLAVYVASHIVGATLRVIQIGEDQSIHSWIMENLFESWLKPMDASLLFAYSLVLIWLIPLTYLYKKRIYIKV